MAQEYRELKYRGFDPALGNIYIERLSLSYRINDFFKVFYELILSKIY